MGISIICHRKERIRYFCSQVKLAHETNTLEKFKDKKTYSSLQKFSFQLENVLKSLEVMNKSISKEIPKDKKAIPEYKITHFNLHLVLQIKGAS